MSILSHEFHKMVAWLQKPSIKKLMSEISDALSNPVLMGIAAELLTKQGVPITPESEAIAKVVVGELIKIEADPSVATPDAAAALKAKITDADTKALLMKEAEEAGLDATTAQAFVDGLIAKAVEKLDQVK